MIVSNAITNISILVLSLETILLCLLFFSCSNSHSHLLLSQFRTSLTFQELLTNKDLFVSWSVWSNQTRSSSSRNICRLNSCLILDTLIGSSLSETQFAEGLIVDTSFFKDFRDSIFKFRILSKQLIHDYFTMKLNCIGISRTLFDANTHPCYTCSTISYRLWYGTLNLWSKPWSNWRGRIDFSWMHRCSCPSLFIKDSLSRSILR